MLKEGHPVANLALTSILIVFSAAGCSKKTPIGGSLVRLDFDRADPRSFISYYFGGLASRQGIDPFDAGIVVEASGDYFLDIDVLASHIGSSPIRDKNNDGTLDWDELAPFFEQTYYERRGIPSSFDSLSMNGDNGPWFDLSVDGVMTTATRRVRIPLDALREALGNYTRAGNKLIYPAGTLITADHVIGNTVVERTAMMKRGDGFWDFAVFDSTGTRRPSTGTPPKSLTVPTQCVGCHLGSRLYDPEKSFPGTARPGPSGPRKVHWNGPLPPPDLVGHFDEHRKRSDGILGLYGTLYVADLVNRRSEGSISEEDQRLLQSLGL